mgnify:CR=1 FL=1
MTNDKFQPGDIVTGVYWLNTSFGIISERNHDINAQETYDVILFVNGSIAEHVIYRQFASSLLRIQDDPPKRE